MRASRRRFIGSAASVAALLAGLAVAQPGKRVPRVVVVFVGFPSAGAAGADPAAPYMRTFVQSLRDLGWVDGRNVVLDRRSVDDDRERLDALMRELVALEVDVIVTGGPGVVAAQRATERIPIVGLIEGVLDAGLAASLARPGRNVTGFGQNFSGLNAKHVQLLKEAAPAISRMAVISASPQQRPRASWRVEIDEAARALQLDAKWLYVDSPAQLDVAFAVIVRERLDAVFVANTAGNWTHLRRIAEFAAAQRLPSFCTWLEYAEAGGLLSYGYETDDDYRQAAAYVAKILGGAKPADLPFEQPTRYKLVLNLKTAKAIGLAIPHSMRMRADEVIE